jgi:hypothetical protein
MKKIIIFAAICVSILCISDSIADEILVSGSGYEKPIRYIFGIGYNMPIRGFDGYSNNPVFAVQVDMPSRKLWEELHYRFSLEYFMIWVPKDTYGITEDIYTIMAGCTYRLNSPKRRFHPYFLLGMTYSFDIVRLNTDVIETSSTYRYLGAKASAGMKVDVGRDSILLHELSVQTVFDGFATHLYYTISIAI